MSGATLPGRPTNYGAGEPGERLNGPAVSGSCEHCIHPLSDHFVTAPLAGGEGHLPAVECRACEQERHRLGIRVGLAIFSFLTFLGIFNELRLAFGSYAFAAVSVFGLSLGSTLALWTFLLDPRSPEKFEVGDHESQRGAAIHSGKRDEAKGEPAEHQGNEKRSDDPEYRDHDESKNDNGPQSRGLGRESSVTEGLHPPSAPLYENPFKCVACKVGDSGRENERPRGGKEKDREEEPREHDHCHEHLIGFDGGSIRRAPYHGRLVRFKYRSLRLIAHDLIANGGALFSTAFASVWRLPCCLIDERILRLYRCNGGLHR